jgi:hypothetical protein
MFYHLTSLNKMGAAKSWSDLSSLFATKSFAWASENPVKGNGMKSARFEAAVCEQYNRLVENKLLEHPQWNHQERTGSAIVQQDKKAKKENLVFEGYICAAKAMNPTVDPSEEYFIRSACAKVTLRADGLTDFYCFVQRPAVGPASGSQRDIGPVPWFLQSFQFLSGTALWRSLRAGIASNSQMAQSAAQSKQISDASVRAVALDLNHGSADTYQGGAENRETELRESGESGTVYASPVRPTGPRQKKRVLGSKAASAEN